MALDSKYILPVVIGISLFSVSAVFLYIAYKKDEENGNSEEIASSKRVTRDRFISRDLVPAIIGRGGSKIKEIEEKSGAKITLPQAINENSDRQLILRGNQVAIELAEALIDEIVEYQKSFTTINIPIPHWITGRFIGRGGENINNISKISGAKLKINSNVEDNSFDSASQNYVTVIGTPEQIKIATDNIELFVDQLKRERKSTGRKREPRGKFIKEGPFADDPGTERICPQDAPPAGSSGALLEVFVSALSSPSRFWLQIVGPQVEELDKLIDMMTEYYSISENRDLHRLPDVHIGQLVATVFRHDGKWYRAKVAEIKPNEYDKSQQVCDVHFVDYGDNEFVGIDELYSLRTDMLQLRFQAVECFLAGVGPVGGKDADLINGIPHWDKIAIDRFEDLVQVARWKKLWSRTCAFKERPKMNPATVVDGDASRNTRESSPIPGVKLYDTLQDKDIDIGQVLIDERLAVKVNEQIVKPADFPPATVIPPTFGDLECSRVLGMVVGKDEDRAASLPHEGSSLSSSPQCEINNKVTTNSDNEDGKYKSLSLAAGIDQITNKTSNSEPEEKNSFITNGVKHSNGSLNKSSFHNDDFLNAERNVESPTKTDAKNEACPKSQPFHLPDPKDELKAKMNRVDSHHGSLEKMVKHTPPLSLINSPESPKN